MAIKLLSEEIINQIAAGEVIENPSAVIKELVENSIDAKSSLIEIEIENYGLDKIIIKDNGIGIDKEDLLKAPLRHATSKITSFNDLYNIKTMGFRGEALASIFSIAHSKIISKKNDSDLAYEISSKNISVVQKSECKKGTQVIVEDLFYNTPARKKYLKSNNLELKSIIDIVQKFSIYHHNIKFVLKHNNTMLINKPIFSTSQENLHYVLGKELRENLFVVENEIAGIKISGFVGKPSNITYAVKKNQHMYVNSRFVKSKIISKAIYDGFGTNLMEARHPFYVIFLDIDPEIVDVNVHPTKIEIKFENEVEIYGFVRDTIKKIFEKQASFKEFESPRNLEKDISLDKKIDIKISKPNFENNLSNQSNLQNQNISNIQNKYYQKDTQKELNYVSETKLPEIETILSLNRNHTTPYVGHENLNHTSSTSPNDMSLPLPENQESEINNEDNSELEIITSTPATSTPPTTKENKEHEDYEENDKKTSYGPLYEELKEYRIVGQINKTFIIIETPKSMIMIDQHVAEEKFFYESFKSQRENSNPKIQKLLKNDIISLSQSEMLLYEENEDLIKKLGFLCEKFGEREIIVRGVPYSLTGETINPQILKEIIYQITLDKKFLFLENKSQEKLASLACKTSIKAGKELTNFEIKNMIENLKKLKEPFNCPHGRPILLKWDYKDLEKKFKRIV